MTSTPPPVAFIEDRAQLEALGTPAPLIAEWALVDAQIKTDSRPDSRKFLLSRWCDTVAEIICVVGRKQQLEEEQAAHGTHSRPPAV